MTSVILIVLILAFGITPLELMPLFDLLVKALLFIEATPSLDEATPSLGEDTPSNDEVTPTPFDR